MDQLLQLVLLAVFVTVIHSYSMKADLKRPHIELPGFYGSEYNGSKARDYPEKFIKQLIDSLSPEELKMFMSDETEVADRFSDSMSEFCSWHEYNFFPTMLPAADRNRTFYFVVNTGPIIQNYTIQFCNSDNSNRCYDGANEILNPSCTGCCSPVESIKNMTVLSVPVKDIKNKTFEKIEAKLERKSMYLKQECGCKGVKGKRGRKCNAIPLTDVDKDCKITSTYV